MRAKGNETLIKIKDRAILTRLIKYTNRKKIGVRLLEIFLVVFAVVFMYPVILIVFNSVKSYSEIMTNVINLPKNIEFVNYFKAWELMKYPTAFVNTLIVTVMGVTGIVFFSSIAGYKLSRTKTKLSWIMFTICIAPMLIPFQSIMITLMQVAKKLHLSKSIPGLAILYWGLFTPMALFMYHGFVKTIPKELDECARIDGCSSFRTFFQIIFPLLKPITSTIIVINVMLIWNDFLLPLLMVSGSSKSKTLQLSIYSFFGQYVSEWHYALAGVVMSVLPSVIFFLIMQKSIIKGVTAGAVKG